MKVRTDFVTNSSSSSFIIVPKTDRTKGVIAHYADAEKYRSFDEFIKAYIDSEILWYGVPGYVAENLNKVMGVNFTEDQWTLIGSMLVDRGSSEEIAEIKQCFEQNKELYYISHLDNNLAEFSYFSSLHDDELLAEIEH